MNHDDGYDHGFLKQLVTLTIGVVFRLAINFVASLFTRKKEVKDEPPEKPGC